MAMPRPTVAQLVYGSCTVIFSTFVMLLLSGASSVVGVALVAVSALTLGLLVAMTVPSFGPRRPAVAERPAAPEPVRPVQPAQPVRATVVPPAREPVRERAAS
ncbi:hypothetical protein AB0A94_25030 [Streptomyces sp. NPDC044984]|uniref:hypothetical protein n=1 Tax=Streptomyces sp. NPDC044984 TaxID=3154335 RepID=UPI0033FE93D8